MEGYTVTQKQRLQELNGSTEQLEVTFIDQSERDRTFRESEQILIRNAKEALRRLTKEEFRPLLCEVERLLSNWLVEVERFTQVATPIMIPEAMLTKMSITDDHPLRNQVFRVDSKKYLRPMLAPNLYEVMRDLHKSTKEPVRIFEAGPCFRKESQGSEHLNEFTMLNLVTFAETKEGGQMERMKQLAVDAMKAVGISDYQLEITESEVYGDTLDIVCGETEIASAAYGPHPLDAAFGIFDTVWVGIGFGLERIAMVKGGYSGIKRVGRSTTFLGGAKLGV